MKPAIQRGLLLLLGAVGWAVAVQAYPAADDQRQTRAEFRRLDANRDGRLDRMEAARDKPTTRNFSRFDANNDGKLSEYEHAQMKSTLAREKAAEYVDDSTITARVKAALQGAKSIKSTAISVATVDGVVTLSGTLASSAQIRRAAAIAVRVKGVKKIDNRLTAR